MAATAARRVSLGERINTDARPGKLQAALENRGVRLTRQRRVLLQVMDRAERHLDAGSILRRAQRIDPRVHRVTVYRDRKSTRLNSSHMSISYAVFCLKKKKK